MRPIRLGKEDLHLPQAALALMLGAAGAALAMLAQLPLPILLGPMIAVAGSSVLGLRIGGLTPALPQDLRLWLIPIIGVSIGGAFHPGLLSDALRWWPTFLALLVYLPLAHALGYLTYTRLGGLDHATALFGSVPGGLLEAITMGEEAGADLQMLTMLQFLRLIGCIVLVPLGFSLLTGMVVGSAGGAQIAGSGQPMLVADAIVLGGTAVAGALIGRRIGLPGAIITGPVLLSGAAHLAGLTAAVPPLWMVHLTQLVIGTSLGLRFSGLPRGAFRRAFGLALVTVALTLGLGFGFALLLHGAVGQEVGTVFLAFAPGGISEMSLVALSLHVSVIYVTAHHVARIVLAVAFARLFALQILRS